jgi:hypothetical protein
LPEIVSVVTKTGETDKSAVIVAPAAEMLVTATSVPLPK